MNTHFKIKLFITGIYRSGTTLISRILNNHTKLYVTYDSVHFMRFSYGNFDPVRKLKNAEKLITEVRDRIKRRLGMRLDADRVMSEVRKAKDLKYGVIYDLIMKALVNRYKNDAIGWGERTNVCWGQAPNFLKMFPEGKIIHLIRDPRDVMCSYRGMTYEPGWSYLDSAFCSLDSLSSAHNYAQNLDKKNYYLLRYESLLEEPAREVRKICRFLGIKFEPDMLNVKKFTTNSGDWWNGGSSFSKKMISISKKPIGRWKKSAKAFEIFLAEFINKDYMGLFGYEPSGAKIRKSDRDKVLDILNSDKLLSQRYKRWLKTGEGAEAYPSDPKKK